MSRLFSKVLVPSVFVAVSLVACACWAATRGSEQTGSKKRADVVKVLKKSLKWYAGMVNPDTGRFEYQYDPETDTLDRTTSCPIRNIGTIWDVARLSAFLGEHSLDDVIKASVEYYKDFIIRIPTDVAFCLTLDPEKLGEPPSIAHNAFMILAVLSYLNIEYGSYDLATEYWKTVVAGLANGITMNQNVDGSYAIYFVPDPPSHGIEFYPGEAILSLVMAHEATGFDGYLTSVEMAFPYYRDYYEAGNVDPALLVFFANWQSQGFGELFKSTENEELRKDLAKYIMGLHDKIIDDGFYTRVVESPETMATVEVACGLEGMNYAYAVASAIGDSVSASRYSQAAKTALDFLKKAQCKSGVKGCTKKSYGGFGDTIDKHGERIDVTGHAVSGIRKSLSNKIC